MNGKSSKVQRLAFHLAMCGIAACGYRGETPALARGRASTLSATPAKITIWFYDYAQVPGGTLAASEKEVTRIFGRAGVILEWVDCPVSPAEVEAHPVCQERMSAAEVALTIFPEFKSSAPMGGDGYLGFARIFTGSQFGHYANVYYDQVRNRDFRGPVSVSEMLAVVAAHELGHVLLNSNGHARDGLMRAQWDRADLENAAQGRLIFSQKQSELLREQVLLRREK